MPTQKFHFLGLLLQSLLSGFFLFDVLCLPLSASASARTAGLLPRVSEDHQIFRKQTSTPIDSDPWLVGFEIK